MIKNKSLKNQKTPNSDPLRCNLPLKYREKGIYNQKQLIMALLPYLEWRLASDVLVKFWKIIRHQKNDRMFRTNIRRLTDAGYLEIKYEGQPEKHRSGLQPHAYLYVRRIKQTVPKAQECLVNGTYGDKIAKKRAAIAAAPKKKKRKSPILDITAKDLVYIRDNPHGVSGRAMSEMYGICNTMIAKIKRGYIPKHLRGQLAE